jgi:peroxiredoxin
MTGRAYSRRLNELEQRFGELAQRIPDSPEKEAISVLHGMLQEAWRTQVHGGLPANADGGPAAMSLQRIADLYKTAPKMPGHAQGEGLPVGTPAPDFTLRDPNNELVSLHEYRGSPVVLVFYPLDWSPTCSDSLYSHGAWAAVRGLTFPLLADFEPKGDVARRYGVYRDTDGFSERALYVIDAEGIIRYAHVSEQLDRIPDIYELYAALEAITGVVAPTAGGGDATAPEADSVAVTAGGAA